MSGFGCQVSGSRNVTWHLSALPSEVCPLPGERVDRDGAFISRMRDAGRAFARRRVKDGQGASPATARRRVRGQLHGKAVPKLAGFFSREAGSAVFLLECGSLLAGHL